MLILPALWSVQKCFTTSKANSYVCEPHRRNMFQKKILPNKQAVLHFLQSSGLDFLHYLVPLHNECTVCTAQLLLHGCYKLVRLFWFLMQSQLFPVTIHFV